MFLPYRRETVMPDQPQIHIAVLRGWSLPDTEPASFAEELARQLRFPGPLVNHQDVVLHTPDSKAKQCFAYWRYLMFATNRDTAARFMIHATKFWRALPEELREFKKGYVDVIKPRTDDILGLVRLTEQLRTVEDTGLTITDYIAVPQDPTPESKDADTLQLFVPAAAVYGQLVPEDATDQDAAIPEADEATIRKAVGLCHVHSELGPLLRSSQRPQDPQNDRPLYAITLFQGDLLSIVAAIGGNEGFLLNHEAAAYTGISPATLSRACTAGRVKSTKGPDGHPLINRESLLAYAADHYRRKAERAERTLNAKKRREQNRM
jgi:hypothetical protein